MQELAWAAACGVVPELGLDTAGSNMPGGDIRAVGPRSLGVVWRQPRAAFDGVAAATIVFR